MDEYGVTVNECLVASFRIFASSVVEEAGSNGFLDAFKVSATTQDGKFGLKEEIEELVADVETALHGAIVNEVVVTPAGGEVVGLPRVEDVE